MSPVITKVTKIGEAFKDNNGDRHLLTNGGWYCITGIEMVTSADHSELCDACGDMWDNEREDDE